MKQKEITIQGKQYPVVFTLDTLLRFEEIINGSFFEANLGKTTNRIALVLAAVFTANENADLTFEGIKQPQTFDALNEIISAFNVVSNLMTEFFHIPQAEEELEPKPAEGEGDEGEEKPKN